MKHFALYVATASTKLARWQGRMTPKWVDFLCHISLPRVLCVLITYQALVFTDMQANLQMTQ